MKRVLVVPGLIVALCGCSSDSKSTDAGPGDAAVDAGDSASSDMLAGRDGAGAPDLAQADTGNLDGPLPDAPAKDSRWPETWVGEPCTGAGTPCTGESSESKCVIGGNWVWAGGYCTKDCDGQDEQSCPEGSHCESFNEPGDDPSYCIKNCEFGGNDCRTDEGYICATVPEVDWGGCIYFN